MRRHASSSSPVQVLVSPASRSADQRASGGLRASQSPGLSRAGRSAGSRPLFLVIEGAYYVLLFYSILAPGLGLAIPLLAGGMLLVLASVCVLRSGLRATALSAPLRWPLACAISFVVIEVLFHGGSPVGGFSRSFVTWILGLVLVQSLYRRPGFLHRCVVVLWLMGLTTVPYLIIKGSSIDAAHQRVAVDTMISGDFNNSNGLGGWFGFCCIYFGVVAVEGRRVGRRIASSLVAVGCLYIVGLTVSRGALLGTTLGLTIALRHLLKRGFVPTLLAVLVVGVSFHSGAFDDIASRYTARGTEETGRFLVWPLALERFLDSPLLGVGAANVDTYVPSSQKTFAPHNSFLWFALASGVLPLAFFVAWWSRAVRKAGAPDAGNRDAPFRVPLLVHTFVTTLVGDFGFMQPWAVLTMCVVMGQQVPAAARYFYVHQRARPARSLGAANPLNPVAPSRRV